jgi:ribosome-associated toxin RatA of RatAB toxin-antitoxin module
MNPRNDTRLANATSHHVLCDCAPERLYEIISKPEHWPDLFPPCRAVSVLDRTETQETIAVTALVNGVDQSWQSLRQLDARGMAIESEMTSPMPLVSRMLTRWRVLGAGPGRSVLVLDHDFDITSAVAGAVEGVSTADEALAWITRAIDTNSTVELAAIRRIAEAAPLALARHDGRYALTLSRVIKAGAAEVFALVADARRWPGLFPACKGVTVRTEPEATGWSLYKIAAETAQGAFTFSTARRADVALRIVDFRLVDPLPGTASVDGRWRVIALSANLSLLSVERLWTLAGDSTDAEARASAAESVAQMIRANTETEFDAIAAAAGAHEAVFLTETFECQADPDTMFRLLADCRDWPKFVPHCVTLDTTFDDGITQELVFDVVGADGGSERFRTIRNLDPATRTITYSQVQPPPLLKSHSGGWSVTERADGTAVRTWHKFTLDHDVAGQVFGTDEPSEQVARASAMLKRNSLATIDACRVRAIGLREAAE